MHVGAHVAIFGISQNVLWLAGASKEKRVPAAILLNSLFAFMTEYKGCFGSFPSFAIAPPPPPPPRLVFIYLRSYDTSTNLAMNGELYNRQCPQNSALPEDTEKYKATVNNNTKFDKD